MIGQPNIKAGKHYCPHCDSGDSNPSNWNIGYSVLLQIEKVEFSNRFEHGFYWKWVCPKCSYNDFNELEPLLIMTGASVLTFEQEKFIQEWEARNEN